MPAPPDSENRVEIAADQCKGCQVCTEACRQKCLVPADTLNAMGYQPVRFERRQCTACGLCYYVCPEPGAITVIKAD
jgi:NAD-dependent dihydropyrimidine dehydrogenase PreA subunit